MDYLAGVIDGAIVTDFLVRDVSKQSETLNEFKERYEQELAYVRERLTKLRADELIALLEVEG